MFRPVNLMNLIVAISYNLGIVFISIKLIN